MNNHLKTFFKSTILAAFLLAAPASYAAKPEAQQRNEDLDALEFVDMINSVPIPNDAVELIQKFQSKEGNDRLRNGKFGDKSGCSVELYNNKQVLLITIPASKLFAPNETELSHEAAQYLEPIKRYLRNPDMYRVLLCMHTDNTGSQQYRDEITLDRVESVFNWFENLGLDTSYVFQYAFADEQPLMRNGKFLENNTMANRAANRRLEIYLMPGEKMVQQAKKGRIQF